MTLGDGSRQVLRFSHRQNHSTNAPFSLVRLSPTPTVFNLGRIAASLIKATYAQKEVAEDFIQVLMLVGIVLKVIGSNFGRLTELRQIPDR